MIAAVDDIADGRSALEIEGEEHNGMVAIAKGIMKATELFTEVMQSENLESMISAEYAYMEEELERAETDETGAQASAASALQSFDDALLALQAIQNPVMYKGVDLAFPNQGKTWRYKGVPRDAFHVACNGHIIRIKNGLSRFGISRRDRALAALRIEVFNTAQKVYLERQRSVLSNEKE
jgi:hypothetical protein